MASAISPVQRMPVKAPKKPKPKREFGLLDRATALPALKQSLDAAHANFAQADARFRGGRGTAVELADAEALLADAEIQLALGVFDVARTRAAFGRTIAEGV